ncbi:MAG: TonB-dependent siderophore receptor [Sphingomonas bacterium]|nr:TonB-dependent siderophore receptor [Sphingomonas bacterium]
MLATTALSAATIAPPSSIDGLALAELDQPIVVIGQRNSARQTRTATKTDTPLQDVPQSISVITAEQIADQGMRSIADVLRVVPGASAAAGEGHRDQILLRGQNTTADFFVDGIRDDVQYYRGLYNLDRVEVLKGPNAMIFGRGGGGGVVNRVTKKAPAERLATGALSLDSHGAWSAAADLAAPLGGGVAARLNAAYETFDSFRDHVDGRRIGINPTLGWQLGSDTRIDLSYEYSNDRRVIDRGIPSQNGRPLRGAQTRFFGDPDVNLLTFDAHVGDLAIEHRFGDALRWTGKIRAGSYDKFYRNSLAASAVSAGMVQVEAYQSRTRRDALFVQNDLVANFATGPLAHTLLVGIDHNRQDSFADRQQGYFDTRPDATAGGTRLLVPLALSDDLPPIIFRTGTARAATAGDSDATATGLYVQDQVKIGQHLELIAGLRRDWFKLDYRNRIDGSRLARKDALWSPRLGLVIKPLPSLSLYASWSKSFLPQSGDQFASLTASLASLAPEKFLNREIGLKWAVTPRVDVTLAGYILDRTNTRATDSVTRLTVLTGEQRSKGIEATAQGRLGKRLSLTAAAALQEARITRTTLAAPAGRHVASVPKFTASLWGRYEVSDRLGLGLGAYRQSKVFASISNAVEVPGFTRLDAAAFVTVRRGLQLQLNVENLLDRDTIGLVNSDHNLTPGAPRTVRATLRFGL